jgi:hypothetical protein
MTEPLLYRHLYLPKVNDTQIKRLLMTLLDRRELVENVRSITISVTDSNLVNGIGTTLAQPPALKQRFQGYSGAIWAILNSFVPSIPSDDLPISVNDWYKAIYHSHESTDGTIALVMALAFNVRTLDTMVCAKDQLPITLSIIDSSWHDLYPDRPSIPFGKLSELSLRLSKYADTDSTDIWLPPAYVRITKVPSCRVNNIQPQNLLPSLEIFELHYVEHPPLSLVEQLSDSAHEHLRKLVLNIVGDKSVSGWHSSSCQRLKATLEMCTPALEVFEFTMVRDYRMSWPRGFGSFKNFNKLRSLKLNIEWLIHADGMDDEEPINPQDILPPQLEHITLVSMPIVRVNRYCEQSDIARRAPSAMQFIVDTARQRFNLRPCHLHICPWGYTRQKEHVVELSSEARQFLQNLASGTATEHFKFRTYMS